MNFRLAAFTVTALCLSAAAFYFGTGLHPVWWLVWVAPLPVLLLSTEVSARVSFATAFGAYFAGATNEWTYLHKLIGVPLSVTVIAFAMPALVFALATLLTRSLIRRRRPWLAAFSLPMLWVSNEYFTSVVSPHSTFGNLAYTQMDFLPIIQIASVCGIWAISFVVLLVPSTLAVIYCECGSIANRSTLAVLVGLIQIGAVGFGAWRLHSAPAQTSTMVTLIAKDTPNGAFPEEDTAALALLRQYAAAIRDGVTRQTRVVVLPEKIAGVREDAMPQVDQLFASTAADVQASIVIGIVRRTSVGAFNESRLYTPSGLQATYIKRHLIPGVEKEEPGTKRTTVRNDSGVWGLAICKDLDFPKLGREYGNDRVGLLLVPAWDFRRDDWLHARMAILRGVENGFAVARSARDGLLTVSDSRGRIIAERSSASTDVASVSARVASASETTFYSRAGDWFGWLNIAGLFVILTSWRR